MKKKLSISLGVILVLLLILNPSLNQFKEYLGKEDSNMYRRTNNFFICSIYQNGNDDNERYFAILGNFFHLKTRKIFVDEIPQISIDSSSVTIDTVSFKDSIKEAWINHVIDSLPDLLPPPQPKKRVKKKKIYTDVDSLPNLLPPPPKKNR